MFKQLRVKSAKVITTAVLALKHLNAYDGLSVLTGVLK